MDAAPARAQTTGSALPAPPTVLLVEDEPPVRELVAELLREEGYEVREARDGAEAIRALDDCLLPSGRACLILLDMMLPRVDGVGVLRHLAERGTHVPVVAMSASRKQLAVAEAAGVDSVVPKPFDLDDLLAVVERNCKHTAA